MREARGYGVYLGRDESCTLDDVATPRPSELFYLLDAHVEFRVPDTELLVQTIESIGAGAESGRGLEGGMVRHEVAHGVADEEVRVVDVIPGVVSDSLQR